MSKQKNTVIEYRSYNLPTLFPVLLLTGEIWRISDVRSDRLHFHNCLEIGICETDSGTMEFESQAQHFNAGDVTIVGTDIAHTTYSDPGSSSKWSYIFVDLEELLAPYFPLNLFVDAKTFGSIIHNFYGIFLPGRDDGIIDTVKLIFRELNDKKDNFQFAVRGLALSLLVRILDYYRKSFGSADKNEEPERNKHLVIAPALDFIHRNYMKDFRVEDLADLCSMSPTHFRRMFQQIMGTSPLDYLNSFRISKAAMLLRSTELPVLEISEDVGFRSISSFNRHFTDIIGTNPLKWRKQMSFIENKAVLKYTGWMVPEK